jgi:protein TonB
LLIVAAGHAVALALALTARSEFVTKRIVDPTDAIFVPTKPPPPPTPADPQPARQKSQSVVDRPTVIVPTPAPDPQPLSKGPPVKSIDPVIGTVIEPQPQPLVVPDSPKPVLVRKAARFATPASEVRPPYPASKQQLQESASLRLALAIDARGRVTAVTPVGSADPVFLEAARRHILRHWRYQPATEGGEAVASNVVITLRFELED